MSRVVEGAIQNSQNRLRALPSVLRGVIVKIGSIIEKQAATWFITLTTLGSGAGFAYLAYENEPHTKQNKMLPWGVTAGLFGGMSVGLIGGFVLKILADYFRLATHRTVTGVGSSTVVPTTQITTNQVIIPIPSVEPVRGYESGSNDTGLASTLISGPRL